MRACQISCLVYTLLDTLKIVVKSHGSAILRLQSAALVSNTEVLA
jgi:hypothetical protein